MATCNIVTRPGDPQALKGVAAAKISGNEVRVTALAESRKIPPETYPPFSRNTLCLILPDGSVLAEPNAIARYLYGDKNIDLSTESWLEWEEIVLRPAVHGRGGDVPDGGEALAKVSAVLGHGANFLGGDSIGLADIVVVSTIRAGMLMGMDVPEDVAGYAKRVLEEPAVVSALEAVSLNRPEDDVAADAAKSDALFFSQKHPKLPELGKRNILITSALPYVNNVPHLGNIIGCVLSADVYARYCRKRGYNCIYICGTDEYGTATETKAIEEGLTCQDLCDKYNAIHKEIYDWFDIEFDIFGRTPTRYQTEICQTTFKELEQNGFLEEKTIEQLYSEPLEKFLADRYVTGTCPKCGYEDARGDQCDSCGALLNPTELKNPKCAMTGSTPILKSTTHIFLKLGELAQDLEEYIERSSASGGWSSNCMHVTKSWLDQGLKSRCITRDLKWGTPVPKEGFQNKVFYVWFDAPIGYISITAGYCGDTWKAWWRPSEYFALEPEVPNVELVQFMGKDNIPFHTIIFPSTQIGSKKAWTMMNSISVTEYLNYEDGKFSKSRGVGVFGSDAKETGIPVEVWRYYLLAVRPESQDTAFQWDDFAAKNNAELNDNLGNFINRTLKFIFARFDGKVPGTAEGCASETVASKLADYGTKIAELVHQYIEGMEVKKMRDALKTAMMVSKAGNWFFQETEIWKVLKEDRAAAGAYISACFGTVVLLASLLEPFMPSFSRKVLEQINLSDLVMLDEGLEAKVAKIGELVEAGHIISRKEPVPLFRKITDDEVSALRQRYAGTQSSRAEQASSEATSAPAVEKPKATKPTPKDVKDQKKPPKAQKKAADADKPIDISRIDLRVGQITKVWKHPEAESLYIEEIDVGEGAPRTVVSGLVKYISLEDMQNRHVVLVCNLKPANMRGVKSHAMVLAATSQDGESVELVEPPKGASIGEKVVVEGYSGEADEQLNPKKKVWEQVQPDLATNETLQACWKGIPLSTKLGACTVKSITKGSIK